MVRNSVKEAVGVALKLEDKERETGEISEECSILCGECVESCDRSNTGILETEDERILIPNYERCNGCRQCVKVCPIDVAGKLVTKRDTLLIKKWENKKLSN
ncbi:hypothetical protein AKJ65_04740 [candidate division MSBL1 archaeon SCGC-AAA259E19]|uniref:4Fe-4S ferredoxin-type domain-containing protein n=1 Tax=candidate division MSBL1 archaeon SCGC-AAA259E19 TaxID=1698264 RepID=A0A133UJQ1_9EURY|nr:hypothetical protein AKJ65_04740 [candidate division MSBL1 archaeon SCGC-AAA259E19]